LVEVADMAPMSARQGERPARPLTNRQPEMDEEMGEDDGVVRRA
jgi:hypothetical protein